MDIDTERPPNGCYQLDIRTRIAIVGESPVGCCNIRLGGPDDLVPLRELDEDSKDALVGLLLETVILSLARQEIFGPTLKRVLAALGFTAAPVLDAFSFNSEGITLEDTQTTKGQSK